MSTAGSDLVNLMIFFFFIIVGFYQIYLAFRTFDASRLSPDQCYSILTQGGAISLQNTSIVQT